jgi:mannose-6-phosphate isomerase-like protein (cupin superfamily)
MPESHTVISLRDLQDQAAAGGFGDSMEARFARSELNAETVGVSLQRIKPGKRGSFAHRHGQDEEIYVVVAGDGRALVDGTIVDLRPWCALRVAPSSVRAFEAGTDGLELLAFGAHTDGDTELLEADWPESRS